MPLLKIEVMSTPIFSVVIPLYNKEKFIIRSVESVLNQTFSDFELLVIDDGSSDRSLSLLDKIKDPRLKVFTKKNGGVSSARNFGIKNSSGKYIAFLDADDEYESGYIFEIYELFSKFPSASAAATAYYITRGGNKKQCYIPKSHDKSYVITDFFYHWAQGAFFCASSVTVKSDYFYSNKKWFPEDESIGEDQEIWFHLAQYGQIAYSSNCLSNYNVGVENSLTKSKRLTEELPFATRLRLVSSNSPEDKSMRIFLQKYDLERAVNNAVEGNKLTAVSIVKRDFFSFRFFKLRMLLLGLIVTPNFALKMILRFRNNHFK